MSKINLTEQELQKIIEGSILNFLRKASKEPLEIGGFRRPKLDITDVIRDDREIDDLIWSSDLNHERIYFSGHVIKQGKSLTDIEVKDFQINITGLKTDDWLDATRAITDRLEEILKDPLNMNKWPLINKINRYLKKYYKR